MTSWSELVERGIAHRQAPLHSFTTYKLGGPAAVLVEVEGVEDLEGVAAALESEPLPILVVGRGSNLVVADAGFPGVVLHLGSNFGGVEVGEVVIAGAALGLPQVARAATKEGRLGLEFMVGIPGSVGGGIRQNAGCFGQDMSGVLLNAEVFDLEAGQRRTLPVEGLDYSYRSSSIRSHHVVLSGRFATTSGDPAVGELRIREITRWRRLHQPGGTLNAGSVFKNPPGDAAGRIIDELGLKGLRIGGAMVSEKHANFFVAMPGTRAIEVYLLVRAVIDTVKEETGIVLEPEIQFAGDFDADVR
ncbi:MAG TPA: UDP-N-acetylmuramate dehydrogenase [Acidimicrobiia bacterium]|jgi:UDP-N-acetylmuramate dehydrogenase